MSGIVRREAGAVVAVLILGALLRVPTLGQPLLEAHGFRQTQTAYTALLYHEQGVDLLHPKLPVLGEPFEVPFEFPLFQALSAGVMSWGLPPDTALRLTALVCFLLASLLLWGLVRHVAGPLAALAALVFFLFTPFALLWSRASLIEYLAVAGSIGWLWAGLLWRERRRPAFAAAALAAGLVAMLVKPTTAAFWVLPLVAHQVKGEGKTWRQWFRGRLDPVLIAVIAVPFVAAVLWTRHADAIKAASPASAWLTGNNLAQWNFGTLHERWLASSWAAITGRIGDEITGLPGWLLPLSVLVGWRTPTARFWAALAAVPLLTIFVFWNLYVVHDYYLAAITPVPAAVFGFAFARAWAAMSEARGRLLVAGLAATLLAGPVALDVSYWRRAYLPVHADRVLPALTETSRFTRRSDLVVFSGYDWSPELPYYSRRTGFMLRANPTAGERAVAAGLFEHGYRLVVTAGGDRDLASDAIRAGRWTGVLGRWVYVMADDIPGLRGAPIAAADSPGADLLAGARPLLAGPVTIRCGNTPSTVPVARGATILHLASDTAPSAKLVLSEALAAVPARAYVVLRAGASGHPVTVRCRGAPAVTLSEVYDQPAFGATG